MLSEQNMWKCVELCGKFPHIGIKPEITTGRLLHIFPIAYISKHKSAKSNTDFLHREQKKKLSELFHPLFPSEQIIIYKPFTFSSKKVIFEIIFYLSKNTGNKYYISKNMGITGFYILLIIMAITAIIVFAALYRIKAGYGIFRTEKWGIAINNRIAWIFMEAPVFIVMLILWSNSPRQWVPAPFLIFLLFELHYFQRSFIFPLLMRGKGKMPVAIMAMGIIFNLLNGYIQGEWLFYLSPDTLYTTQWLYTPQFIFGTTLFIFGMYINIQSDSIIRNLRKPGDNKHYLPKGGMYDYVTSANYFGEIVEWCGFALLTFSLPGLLFAVWTAANLVPRADAIYRRYLTEFGNDVGNRKRIFPFLY